MTRAASHEIPTTHLQALQNLVAVEGEALGARDLISLKHIAVNRPRSLLKMGHIIWVTRRGQSFTLGAMSSQVSLDKTTPFAQWMTRQLRARIGRNISGEVLRWDFEDNHHDTPFTYPFTSALYAPFSPDPRMGGLLFTRDHDFKEAEIPLLTRLAAIFGTAAMALRRKARPRLNIGKRAGLWAITTSLILAGFIPVPMTSLAPAEIVSSQPFMVTAPFDGVIETLLVAPNTAVTTGTPLIRFVDTAYLNEFKLAEQEQSVAEAKLRQASMAAFIKDAAQADMAVANAEKSLAEARKNYAQDRLSKTVLTAPVSGVTIYSSRADWAGRHVSTGEVIIEIADTSDIRLKIDAPLNIGESLQDGARIKLFLDSDPLNPLEATLISANYYAKALPSGQMAYEASAELNPAHGGALPRIGTRGVAKIYGQTAPLAYWLFRRPLTMLRQSLGI